MHVLRPLILVSFLLLTSYSFSKATPKATLEDTLRTVSFNPYGTGAGFSLLLTNSGFGVGGYYRQAISRRVSLLAEFSIGSGKDEKEQKFITFFGQSVIPNKKNYLLILPVHVGIQHRVFAESIRENFRPYIQVSGGPVLGWVSPYFRDENGNGRRDPQEKIYDSIGALPKGQARFGVGGTFALGAFFGFSKRTTQGIRMGYTFVYFTREVQLMETHIRPPQHFFGTPFISLVFGRIW